jgi:MFS family permease
LRDTPYAWYVVVLLTLSHSLAYIDRQLLNLLVDPIKRSLLISDTQLSFIQGAAFVFAYLIAVPLFGRLVDTKHRRNILIFGVCAWTSFTILCGFADTYSQLFIARFGVGAAEACVFPAGCSLISDYFSARRAPRALSIFMLGPTLGSGFSLVAGSMVIAFADKFRTNGSALETVPTWQLAFIVVGFSGFLLAALLLTLRDPGRDPAHRVSATDRHFSLREVVSFLWERRAFYGNMYLCVGMLGIVVLGMSAWLPSFLIRHYDLSPASLGYNYGLIVVLFGTVGILAGPWVTQLLQRRGYADAPFRAAGGSLAIMCLCCAAIPLASTARGALGAIACAYFFSALPQGILAAAMQLGTPRRIRGVAASLHTFSAQLMGYGAGPTVIALVTDRVFGDPKMVGYSVGLVCFIASVVAASLMAFTLRPYRRLLDEERLARDQWLAQEKYIPPQA